MRVRRERQRWLNYLRENINDIEDLVARPGFVGWWNSLSKAQRKSLRKHVYEHFPENYDLLCKRVIHQRTRAFLPPIRRGQGVGLAEVEKLSEDISIVMVVPNQMVDATVLYYRRCDVSIEAIAKMMGVHPVVIENICTPEALAAVNTGPSMDAIANTIEEKAMLMLKEYMDGVKKASPKDIILLLRAAQTYRKGKDGPKKPGRKKAEKEAPKTDVREQDLDQRHKQFVETRNADHSRDTTDSPTNSGSSSETAHPVRDLGSGGPDVQDARRAPKGPGDKKTSLRDV